MVELVIAKGADLNAKDNKGRIPLWYANNNSYTSIADFLHKYGAKE